MGTSNSILLSKSQKVLIILGENIKLARLRRKYTTQWVAERADISRPTLLSIEKGNPSVVSEPMLRFFLSWGLGRIFRTLHTMMCRAEKSRMHGCLRKREHQEQDLY